VFKSVSRNVDGGAKTITNLGPGSYFRKVRPFLKGSFNVSLPKRKFY